MIVLRLLTIAQRHFQERPEDRAAVSRTMLLNALRLCVAHNSREEAAKVVLQELTRNEEGRAA